MKRLPSIIILMYISLVFCFTAHPNEISKEAIQNLIDKYGKKFFIVRILKHRHNSISVFAGGRYFDYVGPPSEEYVTPETILADLEKIGINSMVELDELVKEKIQPAPKKSVKTKEILQKRASTPKTSTTSHLRRSGWIKEGACWVVENPSIDSPIVGFIKRGAAVTVEKASPGGLRILFAPVRGPTGKFINCTGCYIQEHNFTEIPPGRW